MKRLRILTSSLLGLLALTALAVSSTAAALGLEPLNQSFTILSQAATLETPDKAKIACGEAKGSGKAETGSITTAP